MTRVRLALTRKVRISARATKDTLEMDLLVIDTRVSIFFNKMVVSNFIISKEQREQRYESPSKT